MNVNAQKKNNSKSVYSMRNGTVNKIQLKDFNDFKAVEEEKIANFKKPKGIHSITISDTLAKKKANPQTRLWYYDKKQYVQEKENAENEELNENLETESENLDDEENEDETIEKDNDEENENKEEEEEKEEERAPTPPSPRASLKPLPTLAAVMARKRLKKENETTAAQTKIDSEIDLTTELNKPSMKSIERSMQKYRF